MKLAALAQRLNQLRHQAMDNDWSTREQGGFGVRDLMEEHFDRVFVLTEGWELDASERVRRAMCLACMQRKAKTTPERLARVLKRLDPLMADDSLYVRKCCGPFVVGYLGYTYPEVVLPWLQRQAHTADLNRRANVAKAFTQALGRKHPEAAVSALRVLKDDGRTRVRQALLAAVRNVTSTERGTALALAGLPTELLQNARPK